MNVQSKEYQEHEAFHSIEQYVEYYHLLSDSVSRFITMGTQGAINIDTYMYTSMSGTLDAMNLILKKGYINDAFALLRKFQDFTFLNIYTTLYLEEHFDFKNFTVQKIQNWLSGSERAEMPDYRKITNYIKDNKNLKPMYDLIMQSDVYKKIRERSTDNMHYNFYQNVLLNDNQIYMKDRVKYLELFLHDLQNLIIMHLSCLFYLNEKYMGSSDHLDYLDAGMTPPDDSQYWVAPFTQEIFDNLIKKYRPDVAELLKGKTCMHLE